MRDIKTKLYIIWCLITDNYCKSARDQCFWLPTRESDYNKVKILISFDPDTYDNRSSTQPLTR